MTRVRLLVVGLITGLCFIGSALPVHAGPRFPATLDRSLRLAQGLTISAGRTSGVFVERGSRKLPIRGNLVAVSMRTGRNDREAVEEGVAIEARFHSARGWSAWESLGIENAESPDTSSGEAARASNRLYTLPIWVGTADQMAFRVTAHAGAPTVWDLRAHVINTLGDASEPNLLQRMFSAFSRFFRGAPPAEAAASRPGIITRRQWGANERWRECCPRYAPAVQMAFIHHTAGSNSYSKSQSAALVRGIYKFHTSNEGFADIAYNFLIDRYGQIFEGRYGGVTEPVIGAHAGGFNSGSTGISLMGNFSNSVPSRSMIRALERLLAWKLDVHHIPAKGTVVMTSGGSTRYRVGTRVRLNRISGHRATSKTACPGAKVYYLLPRIRTVVNSMGLPKIYFPRTYSTVVRPNGDAKDETVTFRATFTRSLNWILDLKTLGGTPLRRFTGTGTTLSATWDGKTTSGELPGSGVVRYTIFASVGSASARAATGVVDLVSTHPDGTVLASPTRAVVLEGGQARPLPSPLVRDSWYRWREPAAASEADIDRYPVGAPMSIREGTLLAEPDGTYSIISAGIRRPFAEGVFATLGYTPASALPIGADELAALPSGPAWDDTTRHPEGAVVRSPDGGEWTIGAADRRPNATNIIWQSRYRSAEVVPATTGDLGLPVGAPMTYREGTIFTLSDGSFWIVAAGVKRRFYDRALFTAMGYSTAAAFAMSSSEAATIPAGPSIAETSLA